MGRFYRLNQNITAKEVRVIDEKGKQIGIMGIQEALNKTREMGMDLVEIAQKAKPPVVRIVNFKKFKYEEAKKERFARKKTKEIDTKEIWLGPLISDHDLAIRTQHASEFLRHGDRVKLTVKFSGREIAHPEFGYKVLEKIINNLAQVGEKDGEPRFMGRNLSISLRAKTK